MQITKLQARRFLLAYQGLLPPRELHGKAGILAFIRQVGCIQYDPLDIIGNNPDLVLQSRVQGYRRDMLKELLYEDRKLLDGWDKMMAIYAVEDWPYFRRTRESFAKNRSRGVEAIDAVLPKVREALEAKGPLSSRELALGEALEWDWGWPASLARAALESMYFMGELLIHHRVHTRKYYDFAHRLVEEAVLEAPDPNPTEEAYEDWYVSRRIGSVGMLWNRAGEAWLSLGSIKSPQRKIILKRLLEAGVISQLRVEGIPDPFYYRSQDESYWKQALEMDEPEVKAAVIAPLDNLLWDRRMLKEIFDFDYRWEVYVPPEKRRYGYYVLPVLYGDRFIARFEPVKDKKQGVLAVKNWWWEKGVDLNDEIKAALGECMRSFFEYSGAERLEVAAQIEAQSGMEWLAEMARQDGGRNGGLESKAP
jgi:uncharacterized protein